MAPAWCQLKVEVTISGIRNGKGRIMYQLLDEKEKVVDQQIGTIKDDTCRLVSVNLLPGRYCVRYYHDENENMKMDTGPMGIPKEGYGFSNNAKGRLGPPSFEKCLLDLKEPASLSLRITYW